MKLDEIKAQVNLIEYARRYGLSVNSKGMVKCPWHKDTKPSLQIHLYNGRWAWKCFACDIGGSIVDLVMKADRISEKEAINRLLKEFGDKGKIRQGGALEIERTHIYKDAGGQPVLRKVKYKPNAKGLTWIFQHRGKNGQWQPKTGGQELIPYRLNEFKGQETVLVTEGEKDADRVAKLGFKMAVTSAPTGQAAWPENLTKHFKGFKKIAFCYDVGPGQEKAKKHAATMKKTYPEAAVFLLTLPLKKREADISDYLDSKAIDEKAAFHEILEKAEKFELEKAAPENDGVMTAEELAVADIAPIEWYVQPIVGKNLFTMIGGIKGIGKSLYVTQLGLFLASGETPFISDEITIGQPKKTLLIQQEVSLPAMKDRLLKFRMEKNIDPGGRFLQKTTAGKWLKLTEEEDLENIKRIIEKHRPDVLILDPLYTFTTRGLNSDKDAGPLLEAMFELKDTYNLGLVAVHHFSNKGDVDEVRHMSGRFMGNSALANAADVLIALDFLHPRYKSQLLPLPFNHYADVEISTRHGEWPARFAIERPKDEVLFTRSGIWQTLNKIIVPGQIEDFLIDADGEMLQRDLIDKFKNKASRSTVVNAIREATKTNRIEKVTLSDRKGKPVLLRLKEWS